MSNFTDNQRKELEQSAISSDIAELRVEHLEQDRALDAIFYALPPEERRNDGRVSDKWLRKYDHIHKHGGMAFYGVNPIDGSRTDCISFKPNQPLPGRKYEQPPNSSNQAFYPAVTDRVWQLVSDRFAVPMPNPGEMTFWVWVVCNSIPIIITEGCKKALSAISQGFPTIALTGIWNGVIADRDENGKTQSYSLIPSLEFLKGTTIYIGFDRDKSASTIKSVIQARSVLAKQLIEIGCECYSLRWDSTYKGLDDLIVGNGVEALEKSITEKEKLTGELPNLKKPSSASMLADRIAKEWKGRVHYHLPTKQWQVYKAGIWESIEAEEMERIFYSRILEDAPDLSSHNYVITILKFTRGLLMVGKTVGLSNLDYIPFNNGVWSFKDSILLPHSPSNYLTWKLDRDYSAIDAKWKSIDRFLHTVTRGDSALRNLLIATCAAVLQGRSDLQKAFYLFGSGANGKGSFMRLLEMLVGDENTHSSSLENICENRFEVANLYNKRLVICPDEDRRIRGLSVFKSVTGGDSLRGEEKGVKAFKFKFQGMVVMASNNPIFMGDDSYGLSRRLIPIPFAQKINKSERRDLTAEFTTDLPAFTTYLLGLDRDWVKTTLTQANDLKAIKDLEWELTIRTDSIAAFYEEKLIYAPGESVPAAQVYAQYKQFCSDTGFAPKHQNNFCPSLVNLLVDKLEKDVSSHKTKTGKVIQGVRLRNVLDPIGDDGDDGDGFSIFSENFEKKLSDDLGDEVTTVTTQIEEPLILDLSPKPPTVDRPIPETVKVDEYVEYQIVNGEVKWLEIAFHKYSIAREWEHQISLWGAKTVKPHQIDRHGKRWILQVSGLSIARLEQLLAAELGQSPRQPSRR
jgi:putative DNA primase/helicase